jgi:signal recognition particle receptor subunit beta
MQFERGDSANAQTHTSIDILTVDAVLPASSVPGSSRYRSVNDPSLKDSSAQRLLLSDTPGHPKLRNHALAALSSTDSGALAGIVFVVDSADLSADTAIADGKTGLADAAGYLHDILLALQTKQALNRSSKRKPIQVLVAANKMDLFTALPVALVRRALEAEIGRERQSRARGLLKGGDTDADIRGDGEGEGEPLGGVTEGPFDFGHMEEWGVEVDVLGGNLGGEEEVRTDQWWDWIAQQL